MTTTTTMPKKKSGKKSRRPAGKKTRPVSMAAKADRHTLYELSVQCVEAEMDFVDETFKDLRGRHAVLIREDFCGTANSSCEWIRRRRTNRAYGVDLDAEVLEWGREHNVGALPEEARQRVVLLRQDVRDACPEKVDAVLAMNFSYYLFKQRDALRDYFKSVHASLVDDGIFFMDAFGGYESFKETRDKRKINKDFTYIWDQHRFDPINGEMTCYIHFHFSDGSKMNRAFEYSWRMWTLPEIRELLAEAGFRKSTVYWEGADEETGEGDGNFEPADTAENDPAWIAYVVAER